MTTDTTMTGPTVEVTVPRRFYEDHVARECLSGQVIRAGKAGYTIRLDDAAYKDLLSDAVYYSDAGAFDRDLFGLCRSAVATVARLRAVTPPASKEDTP